MTEKWSTVRLGAIGFFLGASFAGMLMLYRPESALAHAPIVVAILAGVMGVVVFGGAAISHNRFAATMAKFSD
jgi:hypothetical protein